MRKMSDDTPVNPWAPLYRILSERGGYEVVNESMRDDYLRLAGRVKPLSRMPEWMAVLRALYHAGEAAEGWNIDESKQYFDRNGEWRYAWRLIFQGEELVSHLDEIVEVVRNAPPPKEAPNTATGTGLVWEFPLVGASPTRNNPDVARGKGAQSSLRSVVGPERKVRMRF